MIMVADLVIVEGLITNPTRFRCMEGGFVVVGHLNWFFLLQLIEDELLHLMNAYKGVICTI